MIVTEFESAADRDYYATKDPAHLSVAADLPPLLKALQVLDIDA